MRQGGSEGREGCGWSWDGGDHSKEGKEGVDIRNGMGNGKALEQRGTRPSLWMLACCRRLGNGELLRGIAQMFGRELGVSCLSEGRLRVVDRRGGLDRMLCVPIRSGVNVLTSFAKIAYST